MRFLGLWVTPVFFFMAFITFGIEDPFSMMPDKELGGHAAHSGHHHGSGGAMGDSPFADYEALLISMWLMYALMGLAHIDPWFRLIGGLFKRSPKG